MVSYQHIHTSLADFMAGLDAQKVIAFQAPGDVQERVDELLEKKQDDHLSAAEQDELDHYFILEHIVRLAKSKARVRLQAALS